MSWISALGAAAAASSTVSYPPQVIRTWRTRSTSAICLVLSATILYFKLRYGRRLASLRRLGPL